MSANSAVPATANPQRTVGSGSVSAQRFVAISYLRAFVTLLVVAHHAALAYHPFGRNTPPASLLAQPRWWQAF